MTRLALLVLTISFAGLSYRGAVAADLIAKPFELSEATVEDIQVRMANGTAALSRVETTKGTSDRLTAIPILTIPGAVDIL